MQVFQDFSKACPVIIDALSKGELVIFPTDTTYGLLADATNTKAVEQLLAYKGKRENKPISIGVASKEMAMQYVSLSPLAQQLFDTYLPGKLTVICTRLGDAQLADHLSFDGTLGIRIPDEENFLALVRAYQKPLTTTSANISDFPTIHSLKEFMQTTPRENQEYISVFFDNGELFSEVSTIVNATGEIPSIIRQGAITLKEIDS